MASIIDMWLKDVKKSVGEDIKIEMEEVVKWI